MQFLVGASYVTALLVTQEPERKAPHHPQHTEHIWIFLYLHFPRGPGPQGFHILTFMNIQQKLSF